MSLLGIRGRRCELRSREAKKRGCVSYQRRLMLCNENISHQVSKAVVVSRQSGYVEIGPQATETSSGCPDGPLSVTSIFLALIYYLFIRSCGHSSILSRRG
ncbi:hypothetical protein M378DRAFT_740884 [Amanita muscaria Koide BX008]|uniref:Uncharacterized protein n=1 Tax=Amanita muscaria (strain Koide BX008) TaxID=946122 RepID=A0A0C2W0M6_AMAMK|nr:hypothetical protein M378DRAFT_740884 [Amanita muscaria Koide BX008]